MSDNNQQPNDLFEPMDIGPCRLRNRIVMAPMTRARAGEDGVPTELNAHYYVQRAGAGLIITEGTAPSVDGIGYPFTPGIYTDAQIEGWREVVARVHAAGGRIALQIMHCGRIGHPDGKPEGADIVAPSAVQADGEIFTPTGKQAFVQPRALTRDEIPGVIDEFRQAAANAFEAGFDMVELHGANGYLPHQFLSAHTNRRDDDYGGTTNHRMRFMTEVLEAMSEVAGSQRVGVRISPGNAFNDVREDDTAELYPPLLDRLNQLNLAYLHVERMADGPIDNIGLARERFAGPRIVNNDYDLEQGNAALAAGDADLVSFGRYYISNPDLVERWRQGAPLTPVNYKTIYGGGEIGYSDYPSLTDPGGR